MRAKSGAVWGRARASCPPRFARACAPTARSIRAVQALGTVPARPGGMTPEFVVLAAVVPLLATWAYGVVGMFRGGASDAELVAAPARRTDR
jgi:hypothetical protein